MQSDPDLRVGERVKRLREGAGLSVEQLATRCKLDEDQIRRIEEELISPALGVLVKICEGLGVRLGRFFEQGPRKYYSLFRSDDQKVRTRFATKNGTDYGYEYHSLGAEKRERYMEPFLITVSPPSDESHLPTELEELARHSGEEFVYVLEGEIEIHLQDERFVLRPGDSLYYDASMPHRVIHRGKQRSRVLAVIYLPRQG
ncbi:MAG: cupin domain-containing protein [Deltaproteobacteria bacterium]|nr:cupin domain-containing protein [Deltaproteobacteria bacterium]